MRRILLMVLRNIFFVPVYWYKLCYHARHVDKYTEEEHYKLLKYIDHRANTSGNIHIEVHGQENIPEQESRPKRENQSLLNGPQVDTSKAGVVASQDQVDDLLDSLGF